MVFILEIVINLFQDLLENHCVEWSCLTKYYHHYQKYYYSTIRTLEL